MEILINVTKSLLLVATCLFLLYLIVAMIVTPIKAHIQRKRVEKLTNDFVNELVDAIFEEKEKAEKPKRTRKTKKVEEK